MTPPAKIHTNEIFIAIQYKQINKPNNKNGQKNEQTQNLDTFVSSLVEFIQPQNASRLEFDKMSNKNCWQMSKIRKILCVLRSYGETRDLLTVNIDTHTHTDYVVFYINVRSRLPMQALTLHIPERNWYRFLILLTIIFRCCCIYIQHIVLLLSLLLMLMFILVFDVVYSLSPLKMHQHMWLSQVYTIFYILIYVSFVSLFVHLFLFQFMLHFFYLHFQCRFDLVRKTNRRQVKNGLSKRKWQQNRQFTVPTITLDRL